MSLPDIFFSARTVIMALIAKKTGLVQNWCMHDAFGL